MRALVILVVAVLMNLPVAHQRWTDHQIDRRGQDVEAVVLDARTINGRHLVDYRLPEEIDPAGTRFSARLDEPAYRLAEETDRLAVRVIPDRPAANRPEGEVGSPILLVAALIGDLVLVLLALMWWRRRAARRTAAASEPAQE